MMDEDTKKAIRARLRRIEGQVQAIERMVESDRYCIELMHQLAAVQAALSKAGELVLRSHVKGCVAEALQRGDERERSRNVEELLAVFGRYRRIRES